MTRKETANKIRSLRRLIDRVVETERDAALNPKSERSKVEAEVANAELDLCLAEIQIAVTRDWPLWSDEES